MVVGKSFQGCQDTGKPLSKKYKKKKCQETY